MSIVKSQLLFIIPGMMITAKKSMSKFVILISSILILVFGNFQVRGDVAYTSPSYEKQLPIEIKNGTFYRGGRPIFFSGFTKEVTIVEPSRQGGDWEGSSHRIYSGKIDRELMDEFGFNTYQMWGTFGWHFLNKFFPGYIDAETRKFYEERLQAQKLISKEIVQCASIQDFMLNAWVFNKGYNKIKHLIPLDAFQTNSEWDDFFKFDPSNPVGREYYRADYKEYTRFILENGSNPFIYEILNEPFYHSFSKENLSNFKSWVKSRYTNIENANKQWGSHFKNIEESVTLIEAQKAITDSIEPGLWVEWMDFMSDILSQHLKGFKNDILSVDKRPVSKYFTVQPSGIPNIHHKYSAFDYTKLMEWFDVMTIEYGGPSYGGTQSKEEDDPYALGLNISRVESILNMDLARAIAHGKPVCDNEMACRRLESMVRVPSNNYDLGTSLWEQVIHGISSSLIYTWGSRSWDWNNFEEAKKNVLEATYKESYLQNPYNYPFEALKDLKRFRTEIDRLSEMVLPMPRTKGKVGIIFAHKHSWLSGNKDGEDFCMLQDALINLHIPYDYLIDSYLEKDKNISQYSVIFAPCLQYCPPALRTQIEEYVKKGGILIAFPQSFTYDDYGKSTNPESLIGTQFEKIPKKAAKLNFTVPVEDKRNLDLVSTEFILKPTNAEVFAKSEEAEEPLITRRILGSGKIYTLSFIKTKNKSLSSVIGTIFREEKIEKDVDIRRIPDGDIENSVELNLIDRGEKKLVHLVNWDTSAKLSKLTFRNLDGDWYLVDVVEWKAILSPTGKTQWAALDVKNSIDISLPSQRRVLILFSKVPIGGLNGDIKYEEYKSIKGADTKNYQEIARMKEEAEKKRFFKEVDSNNAFYIDISNYVNMAFYDEVSGDKKGGWTDQGDNDLRDMPLGNQNFYGVPYKIIDPVKNNGKSAIILRGGDRNYFPLEVKGIPVRKKASNLYFLHAAAWTTKGVSLFKYIINYANGSKTDVSIEEGTCCTDWWAPNDNALKGDNVRIAWTGSNPVAKRGVGLYTYRWENPSPDTEIKSIDIVSFNKAVPCIVAITGVSSGKKK